MFSPLFLQCWKNHPRSLVPTIQGGEDEPDDDAEPAEGADSDTESRLLVKIGGAPLEVPDRPGLGVRLNDSVVRANMAHELGFFI